jgi:SAM-dependent methyltransferase
MKAEEVYQEANRSLWNQWTQNHLKSEFYDLEEFRKNPDSLNSIELDLLGDVSGKRILHLQCHFGQDSLSLAAKGASIVGVDLSDDAVAAGNALAKELSLDGTFIQSDVLELDRVLDDEFDIVFTSYGTTGWLPDLSKWGRIVNHFLKPGGLFVIADFHPVIWMFDDDVKHIQYRYFHDKAIVEDVSGSYAENSEHEAMQCISWNHSLSEIMAALRNQGLEMDVFREFDYSPYNCFRNTEEVGPKQFRIKHFENKIPMVYAMRWKKPG